MFIESLPRNVAPRDVVVKAKAAGLTIKLKKVYRVRSESAATRPAVAKAAPKAPAAVAPAPTGAPIASAPKTAPKAAFILAFPTHVKARDIIAAGAKQGIIVSANYISIVRSGLRKKSAKFASAPKRVAAAPAPRPTVRAAAASSGEAEIAALILDIGLYRVEAVVAKARKRLEGLL